MFGFSRARRGATVAAVLAAILAVSIVSPAFGGPSLAQVAKTAKKALRVATTTKTQLRRSYDRTHPTEIASVDGGNRTAPPFGFAEWDLSCPDNTIAVGSGIGYGALEPVSDLTYGDGTIVALFNPSDSQYFSGSVVLQCVWGIEDTTFAAAGAQLTRREALEQVRRDKRDALAAARSQ